MNWKNAKAPEVIRGRSGLPQRKPNLDQATLSAKTSFSSGSRST
jgi:hypothetical protein